MCISPCFLYMMWQGVWAMLCWFFTAKAVFDACEILPELFGTSGEKDFGILSAFCVLFVCCLTCHCIACMGSLGLGILQQQAENGLSLRQTFLQKPLSLLSNFVCEAGCCEKHIHFCILHSSFLVLFCPTNRSMDASKRPVL